jgi:hypothetical protein
MAHCSTDISEENTAPGFQKNEITYSKETLALKCKKVYTFYHTSKKCS